MKLLHPQKSIVSKSFGEISEFQVLNMVWMCRCDLHIQAVTTRRFYRRLKCHPKKKHRFESVCRVWCDLFSSVFSFNINQIFTFVSIRRLFVHTIKPERCQSFALTLVSILIISICVEWKVKVQFVSKMTLVGGRNESCVDEIKNINFSFSFTKWNYSCFDLLAFFSFAFQLKQISLANKCKHNHIVLWNDSVC